MTRAVGTQTNLTGHEPLPTYISGQIMIKIKHKNGLDRRQYVYIFVYSVHVGGLHIQVLNAYSLPSTFLLCKWKPQTFSNNNNMRVVEQQTWE